MTLLLLHGLFCERLVVGAFFQKGGTMRFSSLRLNHHQWQNGVWVVLITVFLFTINLGCGGSSSSSTTDTGTASVVTNSFPSDLVVASPTAGTSVSASVSSFLTSGSLYTTMDPTDDYTTKVVAYDAVLAAETDEACQVALPIIGAAEVTPSCYGPTLDYTGHPDVTGDESSAGQLPSGDLGIWSSATGDGEACVAAKMNALMQSAATNSDYTMLLGASMICLMKRAGTDIPSTDGDSVSLTDELNTAIQVNNPAVTITAAALENLADVTDTDGTSRDVFQYTIVANETVNENTVTTTAYMKHMPTATDNGTYKGRLWTKVEGAGAAGNVDGLSIEYEKTSITLVKYKMLTADFNPLAEGLDIFDESGSLDVSSSWTGGFTQAILDSDPSAGGTGDFSYAWQAGTGDGNARIFNGYTDETGGCGFFGYGDGFDNEVGTLSDNVIDGFICNWAGPGNDHSMSTSMHKAQKQCMDRDAVTGIFAVTTEKITYAPTVSCDSGVGTLGTKLVSETEYDTSAVVNNLVDLTTDTDFASYTAPSGPDLPSGF